jgi:SanA protein
MRLRRAGRRPLVLISYALGLWIGEALSIPIRTSPLLYDDPNVIPKRRVGVVLGCSQRLRDGSPNPYFRSRIDAAVRLFHHEKIDYVLVSGENSTVDYNEPERMRAALLIRGIPADRVVADYAGRRTLDSIVRAREVFGLDTYTVISQRFHNERAVYLAEGFGSSAIGFNAADVDGGLKMGAREVLSRLGAVLHVHVLRSRPRYLGSRIQIGSES